MRTAATLLLSCAFALPGFAAEPEAPKAAAVPTQTELFEKSYAQGAAAAQARNWTDADLHFTTALKVLGAGDHPNREVAEILLRKAKDSIRQQRQIAVADELLRLKQWEEAEAAYVRASKTLGLTDAIQARIAAAKDGARAEKGLPPLAVEMAQVKDRVAKMLGEANAALDKGDTNLAAVLADELERTAKAYKLELPEAPALKVNIRKAEREKLQAAKIQEEPVLDRKNKFMRIPPEKVKDQF